MAITRGYIEQLFKAHYHEMCRIGVILLHDEEESRDIVHDIFARLLDGDISFSDNKARSFLLTSMRNRCMNVMRNRCAHEQAMRLYRIDDALLPLDVQEDTIDALQDSLQKLEPPICREIVLMHYRDSMTFKDIAAHFALSETMIYKHLRNAMNQLRVTLKR